MKNRTSTGIAACFWIACLFLAGCPAPTLGTLEPGDDSGTGTIGQSAEFFEAVEGLAGTYEFRMNDTAYEGGNGYSFWSLSGENREPFEERAVRLTKYSGNATAGYGFVFCHGATAGGDETMLAVMINISREYIVGEVVGARFEAIIPWTTNTGLAYGFSQSNEVRVTRDTGTGDFTLYLNGVEAAVFRDDQEPFHTGGRDGFLAVVSPLDQFPETPVHIRFEEL